MGGRARGVRAERLVRAYVAESACAWVVLLRFGSRAPRQLCRRVAKPAPLAPIAPRASSRLALAAVVPPRRELKAAGARGRCCSARGRLLRSERGRRGAGAMPNLGLGRQLRSDVWLARCEEQRLPLRLGVFAVGSPVDPDVLAILLFLHDHLPARKLGVHALIVGASLVFTTGACRIWTHSKTQPAG